MQELTFNKIVDAEALHQEIKAALGDTFIGVSITGETVVVHLADNASAPQFDAVRARIAAHDVTTLPPRPVPKSIDQRLTELETRLNVLERLP